MTLPILDLANAHFVTEFLAVGGDLAYDNEEAAAQAIELVDTGVTHVLDVRHECDDSELWSYVPEVTYRWDGIDDAGQTVPVEWFDGIVDWAREAIAQGGVVLTHCHMGINRGPSAGYAILLSLGRDPVEALAAIRSARPIANIWYAEDALAWHFTRTGATPAERRETLTRVHKWRLENPLDAVRIIRSIRLRDASGPAASHSVGGHSNTQRISSLVRTARQRINAERITVPIPHELRGRCDGHHPDHRNCQKRRFCRRQHLTSQGSAPGPSHHQPNALGRSHHEDQRTARRQRRRPRGRG